MRVAGVRSGVIHVLPAAGTPTPSATTVTRPAWPIGDLLVYAAVFSVAFVFRLATVLTSSGGLSGEFASYDTGVYYAAADALSFGRLPYRDFVLLHPPALMLALTPFAALGHLIGDHTGFVIAVLATMALGGVNATLVVRVARRMGASLPTAALGGLFYAVWLASVRAEYLIRLEPLGDFLILCGLLAITGAERTARRRPAIWAGAAFAAAASVKIWWAVPLLVLITWQLPRSRRRNLLPVTAGAAAALAVIDGPFFLAAPTAMWHMVVTDQLTRHRMPDSLLSKGSFLVGTHVLDPAGPPALRTGLVIAGAVVAVVLMAAAWRLRRSRLVVVLAAAQAAVLALAPSWFGFYADYLTPVAAVTVAAGCASIRWRDATLTARIATVVPVVAVATVVVSATATGRFLDDGNRYVIPFPTAPLASATGTVRCLMSDEQSALILLDALSRDLRDGCRNWVDITGRTLGPDKEVGPNGTRPSRVDNPAWQRDLRTYLTSGNAVILTNRRGAGENAATLRAVRSGGVLARVGPHVVYRTPHGPTPVSPVPPDVRSAIGTAVAS